MDLRLISISGYSGNTSNLRVPTRSVPPASTAALAPCLRKAATASATLPALIWENFLSVFILFLLCLSEGFEDSFRGDRRFLNPFPYGVVDRGNEQGCRRHGLA